MQQRRKDSYKDSADRADSGDGDRELFRNLVRRRLVFFLLSLVNVSVFSFCFRAYSLDDKSVFFRPESSPRKLSENYPRRRKGESPG